MIGFSFGTNAWGTLSPAPLNLFGWWRASYGSSPWEGSQSIGNSASGSIPMPDMLNYYGTIVTAKATAGTVVNGRTPLHLHGGGYTNTFSGSQNLAANSVWALFKPTTRFEFPPEVGSDGGGIITRIASYGSEVGLPEVFSLNYTVGNQFQSSSQLTIAAAGPSYPTKLRMVGAIGRIQNGYNFGFPVAFEKTISENQYTLFQMRITGSNTYNWRINNEAWESISFNAALANADPSYTYHDIAEVGSDYYATGKFTLGNGLNSILTGELDILDVGLSTDVLNLTDFENIIRPYCIARYGLNGII